MYPVHGSYAVRFDGRIADPGAFGRDYDAAADVDLRAGDPARHAVTWTFSGRLVGDMDGRNPADRPNVNDGIQETFGSLWQPYVYRAYAEVRGWEPSFLEPEGVVVRLGRQFTTGGESVRFDGAAVEGRLRRRFYGKAVDFALYGGAPARLFESAAGDWLLGGRLSFGVGRGVAGLEYLHATDNLSLPRGRERNDNLVRATYRTPLGESGRFAGSVRAIDGGDVDLDARLDWRQGRTDLRVRASGLSGSRRRLASDIDAFSIAQGQSQSLPHRGYGQIEAGATRPLTDHLSVDVGASRRWSNGPDDRENVDFGRLFATFMMNGLPLGRRSFDASVTLEGYESRGDFTRHVSGEVGTDLSPTLRLTVGTTYFIQQFDYNTRTVRDDVRTGTARLDWRPRDDVGFEARYDLEHDDEITHHFIRLGGRHAF